MNKEEAYSYLGAILGTGAGFGVEFALASFVEIICTDSSLLMRVLVILAGLGLFVCIMGLYMYGMMMDKMYPDEELLFIIVWFFSSIAGVFLTSLIFGDSTCWWHFGWLVYLTMPFAALGTINGYWIGGSIGEKADEREQERRLYQQKIGIYRRKLRQWEAEGYKVEELKKKWRFK